MSFSLLIKIRNLPGYQIQEQFNSIDILRYFLEMNLQEFDNSVEKYAEMDDLWYEKNNENLELHMLEIARRTHNYITVFYSLLGRTRRFRDKLGENSFKLEYENKIKENFGDIESLLVKNLREYFQHYDVPPIKVEIIVQSLGYEKDKKIVLLDSTKLLEYERLNAKLKKYISENKIDLLDLIHKHNLKLKEFYKWFNATIYERYRKELEELKQYEKEYIRSMQH